MIDFLNQLKSYLSSKPYVCQVDLKINDPVEPEDIEDWEVRHGIPMSEEMKIFYLTANGFTFSWSTELHDDRHQTGQISINRLEDLSELTFDLDQTDTDKDLEIEDRVFLPDILFNSRAFVLEYCTGPCFVVVILNSPPTGVYFIDRDLSVNWICSTLLQYIRLAAAHLGIIDWHTWYSSAGPSPSALQYMSLAIPERLTLSASQSLFALQCETGSYKTTTIDFRQLQAIELQSENGGQSSRTATRTAAVSRGRSNDSIRGRRVDATSVMRKARR